jgi:hypothetical protein
METALPPVSPFEQIADQVCHLDRNGLIAHLTHFDGPFPLDFSSEYLSEKTTEEMRHLLAAALWRAQRANGLALTPRK